MNPKSASQASPEPVFRKLDCYSLLVGDLDAAIAFYAGLGHRLIWRDGTLSAGLRLPDSDAEIVLHTDNRPVETCLLVDSVPEAIGRITAAGGKLAFGPIDIRVGLYAILHDPWGNPLPVLDFSKGMLATDAQGNITGNLPPEKRS
jgi:catechol 2,3-dioxygenase-like lactoylglutathione lyase family enzyme